MKELIAVLNAANVAARWHASQRRKGLLPGAFHELPRRGGYASR